MPSPIVPSDICGTVPSPSSSLCDRIKALLRLPQLLCDFFEWMLDDNGNVTEEFSNFVLPTGIILPSSVSLGDGWLECTGAAVSRTTYATLYAAIGTTWGAGDGVNTFNVPDFRGRCLIGAGTGDSLTLRVLGEHDIGEEEVELNAADFSHVHYYGKWDGGDDDVYLLTGEEKTIASQTSLYVQGLGDTAVFTNLTTVDMRTSDMFTEAAPSHNNMQPSAVVRWYIKT